MLSGDRLLGHYRLVRRIGSGGMGGVYLAEDMRINRQVAIKVVRTETGPYADSVTTQDTMRLFQREMRAIAMLDHSHILPLYDFGEEKDGNTVLTYMVMPYRQEGSLIDWLQRNRNGQKLTPNEVAYFVMLAADALQHAHDHNLVHQDVKPSNFLIRDRLGSMLPDLLLMDFGIAKINTATAKASQNIRGTPAYMAPEQWGGRPQAATDQYALGIMAYQLLTGRAPFSGGMEQVMRQHYMAQPQPPSSFNPAISPALDAVILRALEKEPDQRFPSVLEFAHAFQQALPTVGNRGYPVTVPHASPTASVPSPPSSPSIVQPAPLDNGVPTVSVSNPNLSVQPTFVTDPSLAGPNWGGATPLPPLLAPAASQSVGSTKKSVWRFPFLVVLVVLAILAPVLGVRIYQNQVNRSIANATALANNDAMATDQAEETAIAQAFPSPAYPSYLSGNGTLAFLDSLNQQDGSAWSVVGPDGYGQACQFTGGTYHIIEPVIKSFYRCDTSGTYSNFAFEVQLTIVQGDCGGVVFRDDGHGQFYSFGVCQDGTYYVSKYISNSGETLSSHGSSAINMGLGQQNKLAVVASNSTMTFYTNGMQIVKKQDGSYISGEIGFIASSQLGNATDVAYSDARLWLS